jgi:hypothetical protein
MLADQLKVLVHAQGFAVIPVCLEQAVVESLRAQFNESHPPERNILSIPSIQALATSKSVREIMEAILGPTCFAVRAIFFNKTQASNWKVVWHQDLTISVRDRKTVDGFGPWTTKEGVLHVQPSTEVMQGVLAIRLHLDESTKGSSLSKADQFVRQTRSPNLYRSKGRRACHATASASCLIRVRSPAVPSSCSH